MEQREKLHISGFSSPAFVKLFPAYAFCCRRLAERSDLSEEPFNFHFIFIAFLCVLAYDKDSGPNADIEYSIKSGKSKGKFKIHPKTGIVYSQKSLAPGQDYEFMVRCDSQEDLSVFNSTIRTLLTLISFVGKIRASDNGTPQKNSTVRVSVTVISIKKDSEHPPLIDKPEQQVQVTESDEIGYLVALVQATDEDGDRIWYRIVDGDPRHEFFIGHETGNILLAKKLDWETQNHYNLTISVTDGVHTIYTQVFVMVIDTNDHRPKFTKDTYIVDISENVEPGTVILELSATDEDEDDKVFYSLHASRSPISYDIFKVASLTGALTLEAPLDREAMEEHLLTVMAKDQGTPSKRNYARVVIRVHDHNDHPPEFVSPIIQGKVFETSEVGTTVAKVLAIDRDKDDNARIVYSITSGNVGNVFSIDPELGDLKVSRPLDLSSVSEYMLNVKASDRGSPPLSSIIPVHIMVTMADNAPPKFVESEVAAEIYENKPVGTYVTHVQARSASSVFYDIIGGNAADMFVVNPSMGVILTKGVLDYETKKFYNLTIEAVNMASSRTTCHVIIHILDRNDNAPRFLQSFYQGSLSEASPVGSLVLNKDNTPLVIKAEDADSELNALLSYDIVEMMPRRYFHIDSSTGAIRTVMTLDHESIPLFNFHVKISDVGKPRLSSETTANVQISITDVNDCPPHFEYHEYNATLLLPTYRGVALLQVNATDRDSPEKTVLRYDIIEGNKGNSFVIDSKTGLVTVEEVSDMKQSYKLHVRVSDGKFSSVCYVNVKVETSENSGLVFQKPVYHGSVLENSTKVTTITVVNVLGSALNEHVVFSILNPSDLFIIGRTSGAIRTTGNKFDREAKDRYELIVEGRSNGPVKSRIAHAVVNVTVLDVNDNCPIFVNLPYYAVVPVNAGKGALVTHVHAVDMDKDEYGEVRYELAKGHGELFKVDRKTGEISLKQNLEGHNTDYELLIAAYDGGINPCSTEVPVRIKVIDKSMPVFDKQFYTVSVPENIELLSPLSVGIQAVSSLDRKLIYSIVKGNDFEEFALNFNTGVIRVVDELDYETKKDYELTVRATDGVTGVYAEVLVNVIVEDVNDCPPEFSQDLYNVSVSEATPFGTSVFRVTIRDNDTGINQKVRFDIQPDGTNVTDYFHIDQEEGSIFLKRALDHELQSSHHFAVVATDMGVPSLSSTAHIWVTVTDMNDNPPKFEQPSYNCRLSEHATRGQFITVVAASDPDYVDRDKLHYAIVGGNDHQIFAIDHSSGVITLINLQNFQETQYLLNVSVSDGVYTSFSRVRIEILPANLHNPTFGQPQIEVRVDENKPAGTFVAHVQATDRDFGQYGELTYYISSELMREFFEMNKTTGVMRTRQKLDRETKRVHEVPVTAFDQGGRPGFLNVRVRVGDENDNSPVFQLSEYKSTIPANLTIESGFLKVKATDLDEGTNSEVEYSITDPSSQNVKDIFGINKQTGGIYLAKSALQYHNQLFQFFVKAEDKGTPSKHSHVPVEIYVMGPNDVAPMFERKDDKFFLSEKSTPGTIITKLKLVTNVTVKFRIVSGAIDNPQFSVDSSGQLTVARPLDREEKDFHVIGIVAESEMNPLLTAVTEVSLKVLDENDNAPRFESSPYKCTIAENIEEGSSLMRVIAHDNDQGNNREVRYSLAQDNGELANIFAVDSYTGWIRTLVALDKEKTPEYSFQVDATDNGAQKHFARTTVHVKLKDYNDNPLVFNSAEYTGSVSEDALPGTVVVQVTTADLDVDLKSPVDLYIVAGDVMSQFQIRQTGEIYVAKSLDREFLSHYDLHVTATDGKFVTSTSVSIDVIDANDNPPYCLRYRYRHILSEGVHPGTYVTSIEAVDVDEQSNLRFYLTGDGADKFSLDKSLGHLKTALPLDREEQSKYQLVAHVQDRDKPRWECSSEVEILVSDLNDNRPQFEKEVYSATLPEDVQVGTLVTKLHATDKDIGINRKIKYSFIDSADNHFKIEPDSGIVTLLKPLDREQKATYNLSVKAYDQGTPQLSQTIKLFVLVLDINDNPPEFAYKAYHVTVPEIEFVGKEIVSVLATSKDTGVNAEIFYSIVGGNEHKKFEIHPKTGALRIVEPLDYERAKDYLLTIQATDGGVPPLSNHATVNISITDSNDNAPIFIQMPYSATIREDAQIGDKILQVTANDLDSGLNGQISYSIINGDRQNQFRIDKTNGYLIVNSPLDREMVSSYVLEVQAVDNGIPELSNTVLVNLEISDFNDNPPVFTQENYTAVVQEDKPPGHTILRFHVTDADIAPNTSPFTFDFRAGNEGLMFKLAQDGSLQTAKKFNHRVKDNYLLHIRVFDNGIPPMFNDTFVVVIEESQYPPVLTPLDIVVNSYLDQFAGGTLGKIHATDQDPYDTLTYSLIPGGMASRISDYVEIDSEDGTITAVSILDVGEYQLNVSVSDGKFTSSAVAKITVELITEEMLDNAIIIRFRGVTPQNFILSHKRGFLRAIRMSMGVRPRDVVIISVQPVQGKKRATRNHVPEKKNKVPKKSFGQKSDNRTISARKFHERKEVASAVKNRKSRQLHGNDLLDVLFAVKKSQNAGAYHSPDSIRLALTRHLEEVEHSMGLIVEEIVRERCNPNHCVYGTCHDKYVLQPTENDAIATDVTSFVSPKHVHRVKCFCNEGYAGERCDNIVNECARHLCPPSKICTPDASPQGYTCQCPDGFTGMSCELDISQCHDESCYVPRNPISFSGTSYAKYRVEKSIIKRALEYEMNLQLRVRTMQRTGTLMYAAGKVDFNVLEIVNGVVQYKFDLGSGEGLVSVASVFVSDGQWHEIRLEREANNVRVAVDGKHVAQGSAPGANEVLNVQGDAFYLGAEIRRHPSVLGVEDIQRGFIGCMDDIRLAKVSVPLHTSGSSSVAILTHFSNVVFNCDAGTVLVPLGICGSQPCKNGGTCEEIDDETYECKCRPRYKGTNCEIDTNPCLSSPCLYGGKCIPTPDNDYSCECVTRLYGKRCQHGRHCSPNPCKNGGVCEEGDTEPICKCRGFIGDTCTLDVDECVAKPCLNGATCINAPGSYACVCQHGYTGKLCGSSIYSSPITSSIYNLTLEELVGILAVVVVILLLVFCFILYRKFRTKRNRQHGNQINNDTRKDMVLNSACKPNDTEFKRGSKLSNLEISQREPLQCAPRPASYTATSTDPTGHLGLVQTPLNNLDTLRSYGSAGDELECELPPDYVKNLNRSTPVNNHAGIDSDSLCKPSWNGVIPLVSFSENNIKNDLKLGNSKIIEPLKLSNPRSNAARINVGHSEEDQRYHWDCSDWVRHDQRPLPNITEVPGSEVPDSSSFHSNESNESNTHRNVLPPVMGPVDPARDIDTLNEDVESEYVGDSECGTEFNYSDRLNALDSGTDDYRFRPSEDFLRHPNAYLPKYNIQSETDQNESDEDEYIGYGFPRHERSALLGSHGNLSATVCEIDDCELEAPELKKLNPKEWKSGSVTQTAV
ncbi:hypothetical protein RUM44_007650 [Polyplax serrata]|uniref:Uncharacterized protein n=1 Tax=Polyplax serrata TaxID=468196 RepID=A0ABR1B710_POLSC